MVLRQRTGPRDGGDGHRDGHRSVESLFDGEGARCYSLAVELLEAPSSAAEVVGRVLGDAARAGPAAQTRSALLGEVRRLAVARLRERPRPDPGDIEAQVWDGIDDPRVRDALSEMPELARRAVLLVYFAGYRVQELAQLLDRDPAELRAALCTAMTTLRRDPPPSRTR